MSTFYIKTFIVYVSHVCIVGRIPPQGYRKQRNYSHSSMGWLTWRETEMKVEMRHAWHPLGEKYLHDAHVWADGNVEETKLVLNYAGCMYHGMYYVIRIIST